MNRSEKFVFDICRSSFLSLWSFANPKGKKGKELCDILVVCDPDLIVFSVKEIQPTGHDDPVVNWERWTRDAIEASAKQIYGAERWIRANQHVIRSDGSEGLPFPPADQIQIHRVAVALGRGEEMPLSYGDHGNGFIHVFDETSFPILLHELDTVSDFVHFLCEKEKWLSAGDKLVLTSGAEETLAVYLHGNRTFPTGSDVIVLPEGSWDEVTKKPEFLRRKAEDRISYRWDGLIQYFSRHIEAGTLEFGNTLSPDDAVVRTMAKETRLERRILAQAFFEFYERPPGRRVRSRLVPSTSGTVYVFLALPHGEDREDRKRELTLRCLVAKYLHQDADTVIGIATEQYEPGEGFSMDAVSLCLPEWTPALEAKAKEIQEELGYFKTPVTTETTVHEYPPADDRESPD